MRQLPPTVDDVQFHLTAPSLGRYYRSAGPIVMTQPSIHHACCPSGDCDTTTCFGDSAHLECKNGKANMVCDSCYLTTACTMALGMPDDCEELQMLRYLRDNFLACRLEGIRLIAEYYQKAPSVCVKILEQANPRETFRSIYDDLIVPAITLIRAGRPEVAVFLYERKMRSLIASFELN
jgi:hypothetical protein